MCPADEPDPESFCPSCGEVLPILAQKEEALRLVEKALRIERAKVTRLQKDRDKQDAMHPLAEEARAVFNYWRVQLSPGSREFTGQRFEKVVARLNAGATVDDLKQAVDGCKLRPYVTNKGRTATGEAHEKHIGLHLICKDEDNVQRFMSYVDAAKAPKPDPAPELEYDRRPITPPIMKRLRELRGWTADVVADLRLGIAGDRVTFPIRDADGRLVGVHRYQPNPDRRNGKPKLIAEGVRDLFPRPESIAANTVWLVEGEPDAVSMRSIGYPSVGVPGVATWKRDWPQRFAGFETVYVCFDCDEQGREAAADRAKELASVTEARVVDLDPGRGDGYDTTDLLLERGAAAASHLSGLTVAASAEPVLFQPSLTGSPFDRVVAELERLDCKVVHRQRGHATAQCPVHDDRVPSLSVSEEGGKVLLYCHAGCETIDILEALGLEMGDLFNE